MAGVPDPLEDMLYSEVDEKAVSDLVGSLESQLGGQNKAVGPQGDIRRPANALNPHLGKLLPAQVGTTLEQQRQPQRNQEGNSQENGPDRIPASSSVPSTSNLPSTSANLVTATNRVQYHSSNPSTCSSDAAPTDSHSNTNHIASAVRTVPARIQTVNGSSGTLNSSVIASAPASVNGIDIGAGVGTGKSNMSAPTSTNTAFVSAQPNSTLPHANVSLDSQANPTIALHRPPNTITSVVHNGGDPKVSGLPMQGTGLVSTSVAFTNTEPKSDPQNQIKAIVPNQLPGAPVGLHPSTPTQIIVSSSPVVTSLPVVSTPSVLAKPATTTLVGQHTTLLRPGTPAQVTATATGQQRPGAPTTQLIVRPQQQTTIQLPPGFTIPPGMVLVRTEAGQLALVPQQVLAQAKAQNQNKATMSPRPATPTAGAAFRVTTPVAQKTAVVTITSAQKPTTTVITAGARVQPAPQTVLKPSVTPQSPSTTSAAAPANRAPVLSQEMQENVKKCKNFLATLIKLASHNSPSPETSRNVKALVQDLLDAKIEPEEFTNRLQTELKSSPQPYLIPFLKKSLPALRLTLLNSQQSLTQLSQASTTSTPLTMNTIKAPAPSTLPTTISTIRPAAAMTPTTTMGVKRPGLQATPTRMPVVITQTVRTQGAVGTHLQVRNPMSVAFQASANQKQKLNDPGGGTFRDDDDINDVASMAGVNLNEENARILATGSELVGTQIRSCKDEAFLPASLLHKRLLETAKKFGVTEVSMETVTLISHATQSRLRSMLEKVSAVAQHRADSCKDEELYEQASDVRTQLKFFEQLEKIEKQRKDDEERELLMKAAKSRSRQEDPEQARLKQKAKEMQQQELAQMRQRDANLTALAAIGPRKKRKLDSPGASAGAELPAGSSGSATGSTSSSTSSVRQTRQRITRVNLRDLIFCMEQERTTARSMLLYKALLK
ncbi:transcription initiation factor TFIID subunit 4 isoform X2 [Rhinichthys klamathensis goyatoka]|uniref:transcription initiation factor TFIID subunit 4 isoform X2 n=1 Tax=Rhinichthys klamathensis goyatoka TaxID=3034132 RepID=UPI0024B56C40|nr:transcription initiation factor TFIID subunit 4 isoform X2 [Rhinichthys klamathensis goyatoka]